MIYRSELIVDMWYYVFGDYISIAISVQSNELFDHWYNDNRFTTNANKIVYLHFEPRNICTVPVFHNEIHANVLSEGAHLDCTHTARRIEEDSTKNNKTI